MRSVAPQWGQTGPSGHNAASMWVSAASSSWKAAGVRLDAGMAGSCHSGGYHTREVRQRYNRLPRHWLLVGWGGRERRPFLGQALDDHLGHLPDVGEHLLARG